MNGPEIVARLVMNGQRFSSENARLFGEMETQARDAASRTRSHFETSFREVQQIAAKALTLPKTAQGGLDVNVGAAREAAAAADQQAAALRQVAAAAAAAAKANSDDSEATRLYVQAARAAAIEAEGQARAANQQANALERLQTELNQVAVAQGSVVTGTRALTPAVRGSNMAFVQGSQQVQDFLIQVQGGVNPMVAFAQQASQMSYVMQGMGGTAGKIAATLSGPWGAAILGGGMVLGMFIPKLFETENAVDDATAAMEKQAKQADATREAKERWKRTIPGLVEAINELDRVSRKQLETAADREKAAYAEAVQLGTLAIQTRNVTRARLEDQRSQLRAQITRATSASANSDAAAFRLPELQRQMAQTEANIETLDRAIVKAAGAANTFKLPILDREVAAGLDAAAAATDRFAEAQKRLRLQRRAKQIDDSEYKAELEKITRTRDAEVKAARDAEREGRKKSRPDGDLTQFVSPVEGGITGRYNEPRPGHRHAGIDIKTEVGTAIRAAAAGIVEIAAERGAFGNLIEMGHGRGTSTRYAHLSRFAVEPGQWVEQGQVIGYSGGAKGAPGAGNSTGPHLHYEVRQGAKSVDPTKGVFPTDALAAGEQAIQAQVAAAERLEQVQRDVTDAVSDTFEKQVASLDATHLRVEGLEAEAAAEKQIAQIRAQTEEQLAKLPEDRRKAESAVSAEVTAQLATFDRLAAAYAEMVGMAGEASDLTAAERQERQQAYAAMVAQLGIAEDLTKTLSERAAATEAVARAEAKISQAQKDGLEITREGERRWKEMQDRAAEAMEQQEQFWEDQQKEYEDRVDGLADFFEDAFESGGDSIWDDFEKMGRRAIAELAAQWAIALLSGQSTSLGSILGQINNAPAGQGGGNPLSWLLGAGQGQAGGASGGFPLPTWGSGNGHDIAYGGGASLDEMLAGMGVAASGPGGAAAGGAAGMLGSIGSAMPYLGAAMMASDVMHDVLGIKQRGGILGQFLGPVGTLLANAVLGDKKGSATLGAGGGSLGVGWTAGNSGKSVTAASGAMGTVADTLNRIAEALGGIVTGRGSVSIGVRDGDWRVDPTGQGITKRKRGAIDFGEDQEAAIRYAIEEAIRDGVIGGLNATQKRLLQAGKDIDAQIDKVLRVQAVPKLLKAHFDPVGAAIDELNADWAKTVAALKEGSASAAEMADAQKLYNIQLEEIKENIPAASQGLKDFLKSLDFGPASPHSLRDQEAKAWAALDPFLDKIAAGDNIDQAKYQEAAQLWLDIERQLYGSTGKFFEGMDLIQDATGQAIDKIDKAVPISKPRDPFTEATAKNTAGANELLNQVSNQLDVLNRTMSALLGGGGGGGAFIGANRGFARSG